MRHSGKTLIHFMMIGAAALVGCKSEDIPDARVHLVDADLTPDTPPVPVPTHNASASVQELTAYVATTGKVTTAVGGSVSISMQPLSGNATPAHVVDHSGATPCTVARYATTFPQDEDQGTFNITIGGTGTKPVVPACVFSGGKYRCPSAAAGTAGTLTTGAFTSTNVTTAWAKADEGRWLVTTNSADSSVILGGIVAATTTGTPTLTTSVSTTSATTGAWSILAGLGPFQGNTTPLLVDGDTVTISFVPKTGSVFGSATIATTAMAIPVAWDFDAATDTTMKATSPLQLAMATPPPVTFGCDTTTPKCGGTNAVGTIVAIDATDNAPTATNSFPNPTARYATLVCSQLATSVTIPSDMLAVLKEANPAAVRITVLRVAFQPKVVTNGLAMNTINMVAGQGYARVAGP